MYCHECGKQIPLNAKFCPYCATKIQIQEENTHEQILEEPYEEDDVKKINSNSYFLGKRLEEIVAEIFQKKGYDIKQRTKILGKGGVYNEIDIIAEKVIPNKGVKSIAIECKNYTKPVGKEEVMYFYKKIEDSPNAPRNMLFVTTSSFTSQAESYAEEVGIELWDSVRLKDEYFKTIVGRGVPHLKPIEKAMSVNVDMNRAISLDLKNSNLVVVEELSLVWKPYYVIEYFYHAKRKLPNKEMRELKGEGVIMIDASSAEIVKQKEDSAVGKIKVSTGKKNILYKLIENYKPIQNYDSPYKEYVNVLPVELSTRSVGKIVKYYIAEIGKKNITYYQEKDYLTPLYITIGPNPNDVIIKKKELIYIPFWQITFSSKFKVYEREILATNGHVIRDEIRNCPKHFSLSQQILGPRNTIAVCEICGEALCEKHIILAPDGKYYCNNDLPHQWKGKEGSKFSILKKLGFG